MYISGYYYTPFPLNLANNKQQVTRLRSVLAIISSQCSGLYSTPAIFCIDTCDFQIQSLSPKLIGGGPGRRCQVERCPPKSAPF